MWFKDKSIEKRLAIHLKTLYAQAEMIGTQNVSIGELRKEISDLMKDFESYREDQNTRNKRVLGLVEDRINTQHEETEILLVNLNKEFSKKIDVLSNGTPLVTELLKKIARLEGISYASEHRRSTEEVLGKLANLDQKMLKEEREEKDITAIKEQVGLLKWVLGDKYAS